MNYLFPLILCALACVASSAKANTVETKQRPSRQWFDKSWSIRYVLFLNSKKHMATGIAIAKSMNALDGKHEEPMVYLEAQELFAKIIALRGSGSAPVAAVLISFDRNGRVMNKDPVLSPFMGKLSYINSLVLIRTSDPTSKPYAFADWDQGIPGDVSFSPAVCTTLDSHRYGPYWQSDDFRGNVGCREWTAQLYDPGQPYIDVTTYSKRGNFIGELVGWSRFEDPPKPVIGMHGKQWLCLHECPAGERPGVIADLRAWTRKHGYPMPERPPRQPLYPDSEYQDDLNEFWNY